MKKRIFTEKHRITARYERRGGLCRAAALVVLIALVSTRARIMPLEPVEGSFVPAEQFFVCFSIVDPPRPVRKVRLFFDDTDVTRQARFTGTTVTWLPELSAEERRQLPGAHTATLLLYDERGGRIERFSTRFYIVASNDVSVEERARLQAEGEMLQPANPIDFIVSNRIYTEFDYQSWQDTGAPALLVDASGGGSGGPWLYTYNTFLTTDEHPSAQTLQRFRITAGMNRLVRLSVGDNYPLYNPYLLRDHRVRGIEVNLSTPLQIAHLDFTYGMSNRPIDPYVYDQSALEQAAEEHVHQAFGHNDSLAYIADGTYRQRTLAARLHFGGGEWIKLGVDFLKVRDIASSIQQRFRLDTLGEALIAGSTPRDNVATGANLRLGFLDQRMVVYGNWGLSFVTRNILEGLLEITDTTTQVPITPEQLKDFFIVNNTTFPAPLSLDSTELISTRALNHSMVWDAGARFRFPAAGLDNTAEFRWFSIGPNFVSLGNENLVADKAGFELRDKVSYAGGRLSLQPSLSWFVDNLHRAKSVTTRTVQFNLVGSFMWDSSLPFLTATWMLRNERPRSVQGSGTERSSGISLLGFTATHSIPRGSWIHRATASYHRTGTDIAFRTLIDTTWYDEGIQLATHSTTLGWHGREETMPFEPKAGLTTSLSSGDYGVTVLQPSLGMVWRIRADSLRVSAQIDYEHTNDRDAPPIDRLGIGTNATWDISRQHSAFCELGLRKRFGVSWIDRTVRGSYTYRF
jgi:hypothetical protein